VGVDQAPIEEYFRDRYFQARVDISSSGVDSVGFGELRLLASLDVAELDRVVLCDSPALGAAALREGIARRWGDGDPERVMVTHGSSEALYLAMTQLTGQGDEVIVPWPCYPQLQLIAAAGAPASCAGRSASRRDSGRRWTTCAGCSHRAREWWWRTSRTTRPAPR
jgi:Aminotransferase class I and II